MIRENVSLISTKIPAVTRFGAKPTEREMESIRAMALSHPQLGGWVSRGLSARHVMVNQGSHKRNTLALIRSGAETLWDTLRVHFNLSSDVAAWKHNPVGLAPIGWLQWVPFKSQQDLESFVGPVDTFIVTKRVEYNRRQPEDPITVVLDNKNLIHFHPRGPITPNDSGSKTGKKLGLA
ncbi:MAG: hypothetical protein K2X01_04520 [Cyanobacteria bacterium]|nr:hypothetical protein [Cyanobacteriota bacterium]